MRHSFLDKHADGDSPLHRLDPRTKLILALALIAILLVTQQALLFGYWGALLCLLIVLSRVPLLFFLRKLLLLAPLLLLFSFMLLFSGWLQSGTLRLTMDPAANPQWTRMLLLLYRTVVSFLVLVLLSATTRFRDLLWGLRRCRFPKSLASLSQVVYVAIFLLIEEGQRLNLAARSRAPYWRVSRLRLAGYWVAGLFLRALRRSDSLYQAMLCRGFAGEFPLLQKRSWQRRDACALLLFALAVAGGLLWRA